MENEISCFWGKVFLLLNFIRDLDTEKSETELFWELRNVVLSWIDMIKWSERVTNEEFLQRKGGTRTLKKSSPSKWHQKTDYRSEKGKNKKNIWQMSLQHLLGEMENEIHVIWGK